MGAQGGELVEIPARDFCPPDENPWGEKPEDYKEWTETHLLFDRWNQEHIVQEDNFVARKLIRPVQRYVEDYRPRHTAPFKQETDMSKPWNHAESSAKMYGGKPEDYLAIHEFMDSSKATMPDNRHRALTHNTWFITTILDRIFGSTIKNSDGKTVPVRDIGEQHCLEDFGGRFVPTVQDYLEEMDSKPWMSNGPDFPPSSRRVAPTTPSETPYRNPAHAGSYYPLTIDGSLGRGGSLSGPVGSGIPSAYPID